MSTQPVRPEKRRPSYADIEALPAHLRGEIIDGELVVSPRPASPHAFASSRLSMILGPAFDLGTSGPGGWWILFEPELSLAGHSDYDPVVPDLAGWRVDTCPQLAAAAQIQVVPDWVCEVISPSSGRIDRFKKLPFYLRAGVSYAWLVDPAARTLEVFEARDGHWRVTVFATDHDTVRAAPFEAIELPLERLWLPSAETASKASEPAP